MVVVGDPPVSDTTGSTVTVRGADVVEAPPLSVARAVISKVPTFVGVHDSWKGLWVAVPMLTPFTKKSTAAMVPSTSEGVVVIVVAVFTTSELDALGAVIAICGG